jgi:hypothetical protein
LLAAIRYRYTPEGTSLPSRSRPSRQLDHARGPLAQLEALHHRARLVLHLDGRARRLAELEAQRGRSVLVELELLRLDRHALDRERSLVRRRRRTQAAISTSARASVCLIATPPPPGSAISNSGRALAFPPPRPRSRASSRWRVNATERESGDHAGSVSRSGSAVMRRPPSPIALVGRPDLVIPAAVRGVGKRAAVSESSGFWLCSPAFDSSSSSFAEPSAETGAGPSPASRGSARR